MTFCPDCATWHDPSGDCVMLRRAWRWFLARFRLDLTAVCEMSAGRGPCEDFHDYPDDECGQPWHFCEMQCARCGKTFYI